MTKLSRQLAIREIISEKVITNQDELRRELKRRGFTVTQATLSRDLHELGVHRTSTRAGSKYVLPADEPRSDTRILTGHEIISISHNETLIVIVTLPGCANAVAQLIDAHQHPDVLGTVAGDNTILVIPASIRKLNTVKRFIKKILVNER